VNLQKIIKLFRSCNERKSGLSYHRRTDIILDKGIEEKEFDFIAKPLSPDELLQKVGDILER
jgi:hypothetical protein